MIAAAQSSSLRLNAGRPAGIASASESRNTFRTADLPFAFGLGIALVIAIVAAFQVGEIVMESAVPLPAGPLQPK